MKRFLCRTTIATLAIAGQAGIALAQQSSPQDCQREIAELRSQNEERQSSLGARQQISEMLEQAEQAAPSDCNRLVEQARQQMERQTPDSAMPPQQVQREPEPRSTATGEAESFPAQQAQDEERLSQSEEQPAGQPQERATVQIQQAPADVQVEAGAPRVIVKQRPPIVTVEQQPPLVEIIQPEAEVRVTQAEPEVTVNQAEANVEVQQAEPQVQVTQAGEPEVRMVQEPSESAGQSRPSASSSAASSQAADQERSVEGAGQVSEQEAFRLVGSTAWSAQQEQLGEISSVVRSSTDDTLHAVVDVGGFFGIGERSVALPIDQGHLDQEGNLHLDLTRDQIENLPEYDPQQYEELR